VNLQKAQTRIAMPAFKSFDEKALVVASCMEMNGWESPLILKATEPHANTVGLFSRGLNVVDRQSMVNCCSITEKCLDTKACGCERQEGTHYLATSRIW